VAAGDHLGPFLVDICATTVRMTYGRRCVEGGHAVIWCVHCTVIWWRMRNEWWFWGIVHYVRCVGFQNLADSAIELKRLLNEFGGTAPTDLLDEL